MAVFELPKNMEDIEEGQLLDEDWYVMRIVEEPEIKPNAKKRAGDPEGGDNLVIKLRVQSDDPMEHGRAFTKYLPWPKAGDEEKADAFSGQSILDKKLEAIAAWAEAFSQLPAEGTDVEFRAGMEAQVFVTQRESNREGHEGEMENEIPFDGYPKAL